MEMSVQNQGENCKYIHTYMNFISPQISEHPEVEKEKRRKKKKLTYITNI